MNGRRIEHAISGVAVLCFLGAVAYIVLSILAQTGCTPAEQQKGALTVENGAAVAQYDAELQRCQAEAEKVPRAQAFAAYIECEKAVSRHLCRESLELRETWSRCKEVLP